MVGRSSLRDQPLPTPKGYPGRGSVWSRALRSEPRPGCPPGGGRGFLVGARTSIVCLALCLAPAPLCAQSAPDLARILERLDRLEQENRALSEQIRALQAQLGTAAPPPPTVEERLDIQQQRIEEQAQTKVEASQKFPIRVAGRGAVAH